MVASDPDIQLDYYLQSSLFVFLFIDPLMLLTVTLEKCSHQVSVGFLLIFAIFYIHTFYHAVILRGLSAMHQLYQLMFRLTIAHMRAKLDRIFQKLKVEFYTKLHQMISY